MKRRIKLFSNQGSVNLHNNYENDDFNDCINLYISNDDKNDTNNGIINNTDTTKNDMDNKHKNESKLMAIWQAMPTRPQVMLILGTV